MENVLGIVAEYNPFHKGHEYHLKESLAKAGAEVSVAVMSGDFVQRGEPALFDKWDRARLAVENGVDLVLELPFVFACNNAEFFARGAVSVLDSLGCVTDLSFGSENGNLEELQKITGILKEEDPAFQAQLRKFLDQGLSYPKSRSEALRICFGDWAAQLVTSPNNILAIEYLKALDLRKSTIRPHTIKRYIPQNMTQEEDTALASGSAIRRRMTAGGLAETAPLLTERSQILCREILDAAEGQGRKGYAALEDFYPMASYRLRTVSDEELSRILGAGEGLENRLREGWKKGASLEDVLASVKSKRYTEPRIRRLLMHLLTGLTAEAFARISGEDHLYARVLGFSEKGRALLGKIRKTECSRIPVLTNFHKELEEDAPQQELLAYDILASDLWHLAKGDGPRLRSDHVMQPWRGCRSDVCPSGK
ncbi:MAG: nucleotidyltransferase [Clostridiales bacterium]|nr:nucleotidyltransferase [Clostridiales bacterium]